ncbi:cyanophycin synthetase [Variovorax sp. J2L1-78]|uniref:cyanophycin synthetase n=2 Tax=Variovorax arabinosiphilus TaxID=3053498 RepID=UPI002577B1DC|nr:MULTISPECIES: cyanophycin synthetase [unclassified Variovorax]MDM0122538.1 cyanophycin synthetase [Variovorax sp. J2L1-78]MDM0130933.1 cyanophycin synthetase [Variovorax sp. J2L1-63]MDM0235301.1 cyanophycin synthetase [Variovorax sp. J2R1-6]
MGAPEGARVLDPSTTNVSMTRFDDIRLLRTRYLRGPNLWTYRPVLEVWLDLGALEDFPSNLIPGFTDRLTALLPALIEHHCGVGERGGFIQRLNEGTWAGHVLEHVVIELLNLAGMPTGFGQTRSTSKHAVYRMVFRARDEQVARAALAEGHRLLMAAINDTPFDAADVQRAVDAVKAKVEDCYLGPSTACIVGAAADRGIPHMRLNSGNLVQLGYGAAQQRIWTAETDHTSAIGESIASDKELTKSLLQSCGVPVPEGQVVESAEEAWDAAEDIGLPVVVKPSDANHGRGVSLELTTRDEVMAAFAVAEPEGSDVMVERFVRGHEHRLLVVGGQVVAAARGDVITVTGDGSADVAALIDSQLNSDPRRGAEEEFPLDVIDLATDAKLQLELKRQGLTGASVPAKGQVVTIQRNGNLSVDCTDQVHPEVAHAAVLAARIVGLDIAGIDLVAQDISRPLAAQRGAIVEVNAGPGLLMHLKPAVGSPRPVGRAICDHLFPLADDDGPAGRIPVVGVAGSRDTAVLARLVAWLTGLGGRHTGLACGDGLFLERRRVDARPSATWEAGHRLLVNRAVEAVVIENGAASILRDGLAYDRCQVGIVTDLDGFETLAEFDITESDQMVKVLRTQVDVVLSEGTAVLNATDPRVAGLAPLCDGAVILYASDVGAPALIAHQAAGGKAVLVRQDRVVLANGSSESFLPGLGRLTVWRATHIGVSLDVLLAAVAAGWALGIPLNLIGAGAEAFESDLQAALASLQLSQSVPSPAPQFA